MHGTYGKEYQCWLVSKYSPTQPQWQQHPLKARPIGAKVTSAMNKISNLSHCRLDLRCSYSGGCVVAFVQCQVTNALHAALRCTSKEHSHPHATYLPAHTLPRAYLHHEDYTCNAHAIYVGIHPPIYACSHIYIIIYSTDAVPNAYNSACGQSHTSSNCPCSCASLHHTSPCAVSCYAAEHITSSACA